jgi:hypothetical protein
MQTYLFHCLDNLDKILVSHSMDAGSDDDAREIGTGLLGETECHVIEVWHKLRLVHRCLRAVPNSN